MRPVRAVLLFLFLCVFLLILAAPASALAPTGGTLMYQTAYIPHGIDPLHVWDDSGMRVADALFDSLTRWDAVTGEVLPAAALSWDVSPDAKVWTFHLDPAAKFSNSSPVTAKAFKASWEWSVRHAAPYSFVLGDVKGFARLANGRTTHLSGVAAPDATTLVVTLSSANADFKGVVGNPVLGPVPPARISTLARAKAFGANPIGNGPFKLAQAWKHLGTIKLVATGATYAGTQPYIAGITFKTVADPSMAYARLQAGKLDVAAFPYGQLATVVAACGNSDNGLTAQPAKQVVAGPVDVTRFFGVNTGRAPFDDVNVRRAASLALDRGELTSDGIWPFNSDNGPGFAADDFLSPYIPGYMPGAWIYSMLDVSQAQALLTAAGHPGGTGLAPVTLLFWPGWGALASEVKAELGVVGFTVKTVRATDLSRYGTGKWSLWTWGWGADYPAAEDYLRQFSSKIAGPFYGGYNDADAAIDAARATVDDTARLAAWKAVDATIGADTPAIPIGYFGRCIVCSARLHDATLSGMGLFDFTSVWITP